MDIKYKRMSDESIDDYIWRICDNKSKGIYDLKWDEVRDILNSELNQNYGASKYRKNFQMMSKGFDKAIREGLDSNEVLEEIRLEKREIYQERTKFRDEKNEYRAWLREQARIDKLGERVGEAIDRLLNSKQRNIPTVRLENKYQDCGCIASIADVHWGTEFKIEGFLGDVVAEYSTDIAEQRLWQFRDEVIKFCKMHNINKVSLVELGDSINGVIHLSGIKANKGDVVDDILDYADVMIDVIDSLSNELIIDLYTSNGNHSDLKILSDKRLFKGENLEKIFARTVKKAMRNNPNVKVVENIRGMNYFNVEGFNIFTTHGQHEKNILNSINEYENIYNLDIDYLMVGHLHNKRQIDANGGKEVIQLRSVMGANDYSIDIKKKSHAGAIIFTIVKDYGIRDTRDIKFL